MAKKKVKRKVKKNDITMKKISIGYLLPIIFCIGFLPNIIFYHKYNAGLDKYEWFDTYVNNTDMFLYHKMLWFCAALIYIIFALVYKRFCNNEKLRFDKSYIPLCIYAGLTILSTFTSIDRIFSLRGIWEQFEPFWVLLGYVLLTYYTATTIKDEQSLSTVLKYVFVGVAILVLLGLSQAFGKDFLQTEFGTGLVTPNSYTDKLSFRFEKGRVYASLYNPNYVGSYVTLFFPILVALFFHTPFTKKNLRKHAFYGFLILGLLVCLFASQSRSGMVALAFSLLLCVLFMRKWILHHLRVSLTCFGALVAVFLLVNFANDNIIFTRLATMFDNTSGREDFVKDIHVEDEKVIMVFSTGTFSFTYDWNEDKSIDIQVIDSDGKKLPLSPDPVDTNRFIIDDPRFNTVRVGSSYYASGVCVYVPNEGRSVKVLEYKDWHFSKEETKDGKYYQLGGLNKPFRPTVPSYNQWLDEHSSLANNRGYIWSRTVPLLKKYFFLGSGPDTFSIAFPNTDEVGMFNTGHDCEIVTKPHNWYLQVATQTGVPSLIALLVFFGIYFVDCVKIYWKSNFDSLFAKTGLAIFVGVFGYLITCIINDSCLAVAPAFWGLLGLGFAINRALKKA